MSVEKIAALGVTFDDVLLIPAHSTVLPRDVSLSARLTRTIGINIPMVSAAMDTVTEARLAITLAQEGGVGIIHKNLTGRQQAAEVLKVKRFESGVLKDPMTVPPDISVREVLALALVRQPEAVEWDEGAEEAAAAARQAARDAAAVAQTAH